MTFIKHIHWKDITFHVIKKRIYGPYTHFTGYYWNQGFNESYLIYPSTKKLKIPTEELSLNWMLCSEPLEKCLRKSTWRSYGNNNL